MKSLIALFSALLLCGTLLSQQVFFETWSGYNFTNYDLDNFSDSEGYVPIGFRLAGGLEKLQLGVEYHKNITKPEFNFSDGNIEDYRVEFTTEYKGAFLRLNLSSLPAYRFGVVFKAGAGFYETSRAAFTLANENLIAPAIDYEPTLGFNGGVGISAPIYTILHWEIGYMYNMVQWDAVDNPAIPSYKGHYHSIQVGLSLNLVFGKVQAKCRQLIKGDRSSRGW